ncbi:Bro-N domain-containing protein [Paraburkholderia denitrificans]|uniref:Bro-N domain-containing protein n=1 Tax=Paraburkholderia denitrificans TaxID=694025 RepID=A0ABW0J3M8_9BURK
MNELMNSNQVVNLNGGDLMAPLEAAMRFVFDDRYEIRAIPVDGEPWFFAADVCAALGVANVSDALEKLDADEKMTIASTDSHSGRRGGAQFQSIVSEGGLYTLILRCRVAVTPGTVPHRFRKWATSEVIPSIRKTGRYDAQPAAANPLDLMQAMLDQMRNQDARIAMQAEEIRGVRAEVSEFRATFEEQIAAIVRAPVADKPAGCESLSKLKDAWSDKAGLPGWVVEDILCQIKQYRIVPRAYVARGVRHHSNGGVVARPDGSPVLADPYFVYQIGVVTRAIERFLALCERHPRNLRKAVHPAMPDRSFNLADGYAKGEKR